MRIVIDTNVLVAALRSVFGASFKLVSLLPSGKFTIAVSVPLVIEYEEVLKRELAGVHLTAQDIDDFVDFLCQVGLRQDIFFLWRPLLPDPSDDMVLEVAVASSCDAIVTYNKRHFRRAEHFGLRILDPREFLDEIGVL